MAIALEDMLQTIKDKQWALNDVDWDAPGTLLITDEQRPGLKAFMAELVWIENIGARGFSALAKKAPNETLAGIYRHFHAEEQKHANAELALMQRWGMLEEGEIPEPSVNTRLAADFLDKRSDGLPLSVLGIFIPLLEVALDGALLKLFLDEVEDPLCHAAFRHINSDESRHLTVGFHVMDMLGHGRLRQVLVNNVATLLNPNVLIAALAYLIPIVLPLISRIRGTLIGMGMQEKRLYDAIERFANVGDRGDGTRLVVYRALRYLASVFTDEGKFLHNTIHRLGNFFVRMSDHIPERFLPKPPAWPKELTYEGVSE